MILVLINNLFLNSLLLEALLQLIIWLWCLLLRAPLQVIVWSWCFFCSILAPNRIRIFWYKKVLETNLHFLLFFLSFWWLAIKKQIFILGLGFALSSTCLLVCAMHLRFWNYFQSHQCLFLSFPSFNGSIKCSQAFPFVLPWIF